MKSSVRVCTIQRPPARCHHRSEPCIVVKPKDQQLKMTASHQRRETDRGAGAAGKLPALPGVARLDGAVFFLALSFRIPALLLPRSLPSRKACCATRCFAGTALREGLFADPPWHGVILADDRPVMLFERRITSGFRNRPRPAIVQTIDSIPSGDWRHRVPLPGPERARA